MLCVTKAVKAVVAVDYLHQHLRLNGFCHAEHDLLNYLTRCRVKQRTPVSLPQARNAIRI